MAGAETESSVGKRLREALRFVRDGALATGEEFAHQVEGAHRALAGATSEMVEIPLAIATNRILLNEETVYRSESQDSNLAFDLFKQGLRLAEDRFAERRQLDPPVQPLEQGCSQTLFQPGDLFGERRLGNAQFLGCLGETTRSRHRAKILQLPQIEAPYAHLLCHRKCRSR